MAYVLWRSTGLDSSPGSRPLDISCFTGEEADKEESEAGPEQLQNKLKDWGEELVEVNLAAPGEELRPIFISDNLSSEMKRALFGLLQKFQDIFALAYTQMPGLDLQLVVS